MKLVREWTLLLSGFLLVIAISVSCLGSPTAPKLPSTLNFQPLNVVLAPATEADWTFEMARLDMAVASDHLAGLRARNCDAVLLNYELLHSVLVTDTNELTQLASIATARGKDIEEAFLHYYDDTTVTYTDGRTITIKGYGGGTAATLKDARVRNLIWTDERYIYNLKSPLVSELKGTMFRAVLTSALKPDGIFVDENNPLQSFIAQPTAGGHIREYANKNRDDAAAGYVTDVTAIYALVNEAMGHDGPFGDRYLFPNMAEWVDIFLDLGLHSADGAATEILIQEVQPRSPHLYDLAKLYADANKIFLATQGGYDPVVTSVGNYTSAMDRHQMYALSEYWIAKQGKSTYYSQYPSSYVPMSQWWCKSREYDIGAVVDPLYSVWQTGADSVGQNYTIYKRTYTKALVLSRPKIGWTYSDYSTQTQQYDLGGSYKLLHYDGTLGPVITKIGLAMGEAVTLVKATTPADGTPPVISGIASSALTSSSALVGWATDEPATGLVDYGMTTAYGSSAPASVLGASQSVALAGLLPSTTYHYRVTATDVAGNSSVSGDYTLTSLTSTGTPKIGVTIAVDKQTAKTGEQLTYTVTYANTGSGAAASAIVTADVDPNATFVSATNGGVYDATAKVVRWTVGAVAPGASAAMHYTVVVK
jgi:uncharacterized repeat protein (TIGR01451 family)